MGPKINNFSRSHKAVPVTDLKTLVTERIGTIAIHRTTISAADGFDPLEAVRLDPKDLDSKSGMRPLLRGLRLGIHNEICTKIRKKVGRFWFSINSETESQRDS